MTDGALTDQTRRVDFLAGLRVLELGDGVAGAAATSILRALGATVTAATDYTSPHRRGRPRITDNGSLLALLLDRGKRIVTVSDRQQLDELIARGADGVPFDVVVFDRVLGARGALAGLADTASYAAFVDRHNRNAWLTVSAFGLTGERADDVATELTVAAAGGMLSAVRDERTGQPLKLAGQQSLLNTGQAGALAVCHAIDLATTGRPVHLDLAAVEATLAMGTVLEVGGLLLKTGSLGGAKRYGAPADFYECSDGLIRISAMEDHQWQGVVAAMGNPDWTEQFSTMESRIAAPEIVDSNVRTWTQMRTKEAAEEVLQTNGVPATAVYSPAEILDSPQLEHRGAFESLPLDDSRTARVVGLPFRVVAGDNRGVPKRRSLRGLRVLEASRVLAVPLAGSILGALGAEVTKLEDLPRLDMYRRRGPYIDGQPGTERSAYFALMNHSKGSAAFDVDTHRDRLDALLARTDVVLENLGPKRSRELGLGAAVALSNQPDVLAISSSGFGQDGPRADYRAYAYNLQASCALGYLTRTEDGHGAEIDIAWADLVSAYALATIVAAWAVGPSGNTGTGIDFSMADLVIAHFNEFIAAASLDPRREAVDRANELSPYAPNGVYPTSDGWVALSVEDDEQFTRLSKVLGSRALTDSMFDTSANRFEQRRVLDRRIADATRNRAAVELAADLRAAGVPAEQVRGAEELLADAQLASREFLTAVEHTEWGGRQIVGIPWRPFGASAMRLGPPPLLVPLDDD
jgi:crotonobetainyl-CoA:carnitine CoA-transferase CaiB-like acyl-CoA transferase